MKSMVNLFQGIFSEKNMESKGSGMTVVWEKMPDSFIEQDNTEEFEELKKQRITPYLVTSLNNNEVFVFGSVCKD